MHEDAARSLQSIGTLAIRHVPIGTGFVVSDAGLIATCAHVLRAATAKFGSLDDLTFSLFSRPGPRNASLDGDWDVEHDAALLKLEPTASSAKLAVAPLVASASAIPGMAFNSTGYGVLPAPGHTFDQVSAIGTVAGPARCDNVDLLQIQSESVLKGMSGAPIIVQDAGGVVGLISQRYVPQPGSTTGQHIAFGVFSEHLVALRPTVLRLTARPARPDLQGLLETFIAMTPNFTGRRSSTDPAGSIYSCESGARASLGFALNNSGLILCMSNLGSIERVRELATGHAFPPQVVVSRSLLQVLRIPTRTRGLVPAYAPPELGSRLFAFDAAGERVPLRTFAFAAWIMIPATASVVRNAIVTERTAGAPPHGGPVVNDADEVVGFVFARSVLSDAASVEYVTAWSTIEQCITMDAEPVTVNTVS